MYRNLTLAELQSLRSRNQLIQTIYAPFTLLNIFVSGFWAGIVIRRWDEWNHWQHGGGLAIVCVTLAAGIYGLYVFVKAREKRIPIDQFIDYGLYNVAVDETVVDEPLEPR